MSQVKLHYLYDPLCGWCYGAAPLIKVARDIMAIDAHGGGLMAGDARRPVTSELRGFVVAHDDRIGRISGQVFGEAYVNGLLCDETAMFDSEPPITAILAAQQVAQRGLDMLARLQTAHYVEGRKIVDAEVLRATAADIGLDADDFERAFAQLEGAATQAHIDSSRALMERTNSYGFPTLVLERKGTFSPIDITAYFGRADEWRSSLMQHLALDADVAGHDATCSPNGNTP